MKTFAQHLLDLARGLVRPQNPHLPEAQRLLAAFMQESGGQPVGFNAHAIETGRAILTAAPPIRAAVLIALFRLGPQEFREADQGWLGRFSGCQSLIPKLLLQSLPFTDDEFVQVIAAADAGSFFGMSTSRADIIRAVEAFVSANGMSPQLRSSLELVHTKLSRQSSKHIRQLADRVLKLLGGTIPKKAIPITDRDAWSSSALTLLSGMDDATRAPWLALLEYAATADTSKPSKKWLKNAEPLLTAIGHDDAAAAIATWLSLIGAPGPHRAPQEQNNTIPDAENADVLKGLIWAASLLDETKLLEPISTASEACFKKIPYVGPRSVKLGNACLWYLSTMKGDRAISELVRIRAKARHPSVRGQIDKAVNRQAASRGQTPEDAMELAVPTFDLALPGTLRRTIGDYEAELTITGSAEATITWKSATGRITRSTPKPAKEADPDGVKSILRTQREIERTLPGQRHRLERLYLADRLWTLSDWRKRFVDHPLLHNLSSRLIWNFASGSDHVQAVPREGSLIGITGAPISPPSDSRISLWHPITSPADLVAAWRQRLPALNIQQPFKQAHREIYSLTDAERTTETYSNRFAAHILRQHQMAELCRGRSWTYHLAGMHFDSGGVVPTLAIPAADLTAEFLVEPIEDPADQQVSGISIHVTTDQVCFHRTGHFDRLALRDVPPIIFTEVLRDVDLFVGVCSVGNDPQWQDGGRTHAQLGYWRSFSFGDIGQSGQSRRAALESIIPRLSIAGACTLGDKYLTVRGHIRTYKIHLGSGNILMEPNDQYLCIVPAGRSAADDISLPFEGDRVLSIILSKAFMLAADDRITDPTITRQIGRPR